MTAFVIDFNAERRAREEETRAKQARTYLLDCSAAVLTYSLGIPDPFVARQMIMDLMTDPLPEELTEAHILKLERDRT